MAELNHIAVDLGAESGRVMLGRFDGRELRLEEHRRFANNPVTLGGRRRWNMTGLWGEIAAGVEICRNAAHGTLAGVSADSWGVDYALVGSGSPMLAPPVQYRDPRTDATFARALEQLGREEIFGHTGIQFQPFNTLYQLMAEPPELLAAADTFLPIADFVNWLLAGELNAGVAPRCEVSMASTTQAFDVQKRAWATELIEKLDLPATLFPEVVDSGTKLGTSPDGLDVWATCSHDTGAAVAAVPAEAGENWAFLSSGTWSLLGVELPGPVVTDRCRELNFTNELGYAGTTRLLKNISGLYILQQSRLAWEAAGRRWGYHELAPMAGDAPPWATLVRPEHADFSKPGDMPGRIHDYCRRTGQPAPEGVGGVVRCIYESLALLYRKTLGELAELAGRQIEVLHVVGGGTQARLLNQLAADATGLRVVTGPVEATAMGNVLIQLAATGAVGRGDLRQIVRASTRLETYEPQGRAAADDAYARFVELPVE